MKVGFIGLGKMGQGMARRLLDASHDLTVWNRNRDKAEALQHLGASIATTPREAAETGIVFTMLANDAALEAVSFGGDGILAARGGITHVSCSTVSVALIGRLVEEHADANQNFISAPVFGGPDAAAAGQLVFVVGGPQDMRTRCAPLFGAIGQKVLVTGKEPATAAAAKLATNYSLAAVIDTLTDAFAIAESGGVTPEALLELYEQVNFGTRMANIYGRVIPKFEPSASRVRSRR